MTPNVFAAPSLIELSSASLTSRITALVGEERRCILDFLWHLAEMDRRELHLELGFESLFDYCRRGLKFTRAASWRRSTSARLLQSFPSAADYLGDGRLCMTTLVLLKDLLTAENHRELLDRAAGKTEDEVKVLVATVQPRPEVRDSIRRVPTRSPSMPEPQAPLLAAPVTCNVDSTVSSSGPELQRTSPVAPPLPPPLPTPARARLEPIDAERYALKLTVGPEFMAEFAEVKAALSHRIPDGNLEAVLRACIQKTLEVYARQKHAERASPEPMRPKHEDERNASAKQPARCATGPARSRCIPAAVRRAVWKRDGGCCSFIGADGRRCGSKHQLEYDHLKPFAFGGESTVDNVALRCRSHNQFRARQHFGGEHMARFTRSGRERRQVELFSAPESPSDRGVPISGTTRRRRATAR